MQVLAGKHAGWCSLRVVVVAVKVFYRRRKKACARVVVDPSHPGCHHEGACDRRISHWTFSASPFTLFRVTNGTMWDHSRYSGWQ